MGNEVITGGNTDDGSNDIESEKTIEEPEGRGGNVGNAELGNVSVLEKTEGDGERIGDMVGVLELGITEEPPSLEGLGVDCADTTALDREGLDAGKEELASSRANNRPSNVPA